MKNNKKNINIRYMNKRKKSIKKGGSNNWSSSNSNNNSKNKNSMNREKVLNPGKPKAKAFYTGKKDILEIGDEKLFKIEKEDDKRLYFVCNVKIIGRKFLREHVNSSNKKKIIVGELELNIKETSKEIRGKVKEILNKFNMIKTLSNVKDEFISNIIQLLWDETFEKTKIVEFKINEIDTYNKDKQLLYLDIGDEKWLYKIIK